MTIGFFFASCNRRKARHQFGRKYSRGPQYCSKAAFAYLKRSNF